MCPFLCITVRFLQPYSHGRGEGGVPEWPPSPLRLTQALVAASAGRWNERNLLQHATAAISWLETLPQPRIIAAKAVASLEPYRLYVPDNAADRIAAVWSKGRDASIADYRTEKDVQPCVLDGEAVQYLYSLPTASTVWREHINTLTVAARSITHLGWGIDMVVGDASVLSAEEVATLEGIRWHPSPSGSTPLRVPKAGTLDDLMRKHADFLSRITDKGFRPVPPLRVFDIVRYRSQHDPAQCPCRVFELRNHEGKRSRYSPRKLIHLAGMVRHLAIEAMKKDPPRNVNQDWVETYVAGHAADGVKEHRQLSYLPLTSVGQEHTDPGVRRVMIAAPVGDDAWLDHIARRLNGQQLKPVRGDEFGFDQDGNPNDPPILVRVNYDSVARRYTKPSNVWHSFTPVILPGHDDRKPAKTIKLIQKALAQSGIEQECEFEWSAFSRFRKSYSAHKYDRNGRLTGYLRPDHLRGLTAVHLSLRFGRREISGDPKSRWVQAEMPVPGPLAIGAGRHCGLGIFATMHS